MVYRKSPLSNFEELFSYLVHSRGCNKKAKPNDMKALLSDFSVSKICQVFFQLYEINASSHLNIQCFL